MKRNEKIAPDVEHQRRGWAHAALLQELIRAVGRFIHAAVSVLPAARHPT